MKQIKQVLFITILCLALTGPGYGGGTKLPVIDGKAAVATVNDEPITVEELKRAVAASHSERIGDQEAGRIDYSNVINRLINTRLILLEARNMGLDKLPEVKEQVDTYAAETLMKLVLEEHIKGMEPDGEEERAIYQELVREWKIKSVLLKEKDDAVKIRDEIGAGNNFDQVVARAVELGVADAEDEGEYVKESDLLLPVAREIAKMEVGSISPVIPLEEKGFVIFELEDLRFPEDAEARQKARQEALRRKRARAVKEYYNNLRDKYVTVNKELLEGIDYEAEEPGLEKLFKDERAVAEIDGENPITVGELTEALKDKFYHGFEQAIEGKRVNRKKEEILEKVIEKRVLLKEASRKNIDKSEEYKTRVEAFKKSTIFGIFVTRVIFPEIKITPEELKDYYQKNIESYSSPEMMRIESLVFRQKNDAAVALDRLVKGTDFKWLSSHAEGQVEPDSTGLLQFKGALLTVGSLPEDVRQAVSGAKQGDFRLYASPEGHFYVLHIYEVIPAKPRPFHTVQEKIAKMIFSDKAKRAVENYAEKLRDYYPVKIYAKGLH